MNIYIYIYNFSVLTELVGGPRPVPPKTNTKPEYMMG